MSRLNCVVENTLRHAISTNFHAQPQTVGLDRYTIRRMKLNLSKKKNGHGIGWEWARAVIVAGIQLQVECVHCA